MKHFLRSLERQFGRNTVASIGVLEKRRFSGLGYSETPFHWHFVLVTLHHNQSALIEDATKLWSSLYGDSEIEAFDSHRDGLHYIAKTMAFGDPDFVLHNLDRLTYCGPTDLYEHHKHDPYVPEHAREMTHGRTLRVDKRAPLLHRNVDR